MSSRLMEIEAKKARIAELKRLREEKRMRTVSSSSNLSESKPSSTISKDIDDLVNSLVGSTVSRSSTPSESARNASSLSMREVQSPGISSLAGSPRTSLPGSMQPPSLPEFEREDSFSSTTDVVAQAAPPAVATRLETITYSKEIQTSESWLRDQQTNTTEEEKEKEEDDSRISFSGALSREEMARLREAIRAEVEEEFKRKMVQDTPKPAGQNKTQKEEQFSAIEIEICDNKNNTPEVEIQYKEREQAADELAQFLDQSLKVVSRALDYDYDITTDYAANSGNGISSSVFGAHGSGSTGPTAELTEIAQFFSAEHSAGRAVTDLDWSPFHSELLASAYTEQRVGAGGGSCGPKGLVLVWNMHAPSRPEYVFTARSDVLAVRFSPFDANILLGTAYNGQVMAWDMRVPPRGGSSGSSSRSGKGLVVGYRDPVLTSPLNGSGHTHPTYTMAVTGTRHAHTVLTASTDGVVCTWAPDMLAVPQDRLTLSAPFMGAGGGSSSAGLSGLSGISGAHGLMASMSGFRSDEVAPTQLAVLPRDSSRFVVGTEEGAIYSCARFGQAGARAGIVGVGDGRPLSSSLSSSPNGGFGGALSSSSSSSSIGGVYRGHSAPVTSLDFHSPRGPSDFSDLLLSGSLDWSIKLWRVRGGSSHYPAQVSPTRGAGGGGLASLGLGSPGNSSSGIGGPGRIAPLLDIARDYEVYDVAWSPAHAAVFAVVDGSGHVEVWDLSRDTEAPVARAKPSVYSGGFKQKKRKIKGRLEGANFEEELEEEKEKEEEAAEEGNDWRNHRSPEKNNGGGLSYLGTRASLAGIHGGNGNGGSIHGSIHGITSSGSSNGMRGSTGEYLVRPLNRVAWDKLSPEEVEDQQQEDSTGDSDVSTRGAMTETGTEAETGTTTTTTKTKTTTTVREGSESTRGGGSSGASNTWGSGGRRVAVGGVDGIVSVFGVGAGVCTAKAGDWLQMERLVAQLEEDLVASDGSSSNNNNNNNNSFL
ncbi:uncharacterized protein SAPINGB_P005179 [Magnusiomyces paraingens]|uniref:Uncharacterized protein n=1 Tax=Magnusiomyces paraingens TaxID=2606893 RepID=A0A5E8C5X8_9ASCO|nr:uncharacterized protein SAPINGB_P005179 [Saprochaete ingens]VVT56616.1 unnamed protein product [Saprochaete ingens]